MGDGPDGSRCRAVYWAHTMKTVAYDPANTSILPDNATAIPLILAEDYSTSTEVTAFSYVGIDISVRKPSELVANEDNGAAILFSYHKYNGQATFGFWAHISGYYVFYCAVDRLTRLTDQANRVVGGVLTGCSRSTHNFDWYNVIDTRNRCERTIRSNRFIRGQYPRSMITKDHHTHLRPENILQFHSNAQVTMSEDSKSKIEAVTCKCDCDRCEALYTLIAKAGTFKLDIESTMATFTLYIYTAPEWAVRFLHWIMCISGDDSDLRAALKYEGLVAKQLQHKFRNDLSVIFELSVLVNRVDASVDWVAEKAHRTDNMSVNAIDSHTVKQHAKVIFEQALVAGKVPKPNTWNDYWSMRWATMPVGSFVSQYEEDNREKKQIPDPRLANKTTVLATVGRRDFTYYSDRQPEIYASVSTKYEWGKVRALYGCDITSMLMADFSMGSADDCLPGYFPVGQNANAEYVSKAFSAMKGIPVCYDYDDFNTQHSVSSMRAVLQAWGEVYSNFLTQDQIMALGWTIKSLEHMVVNNTVVGDKYVAQGTLFSGWRLTSFVNSILNRVYLIEADLRQLTTYALHNGDDVYAVADKMSHVITLINRAQAKGIRAQTTKMAIGTIGEFLRVDNLATSPTGSQYLTRACATAVHSRIESEAALTFMAAADANDERMQALIDRGGCVDMVKALSGYLDTRLGDIFKVDTIMVDMYRRLHPVQGGRNKDAEIGAFKITIEKTVIDQPARQQLAEMMLPGASDYIRTVARQFDIPDDKIRWGMANEINKLLVSSYDTKFALVDDVQGDAKFSKALYKAHKAKRTVANLSKARLLRDMSLTFYDGVSESVMQMIRKSEQPFRLMSIVL